jgi:hypothetical protein
MLRLCLQRGFLGGQMNRYHTDIIISLKLQRLVLGTAWIVTLVCWVCK